MFGTGKGVPRTQGSSVDIFGWFWRTVAKLSRSVNHPEKDERGLDNPLPSVE
jgi:hypothetical protein